MSATGKKMSKIYGGHSRIKYWAFFTKKNMCVFTKPFCHQKVCDSKRPLSCLAANELHAMRHNTKKFAEWGELSWEAKCLKNGAKKHQKSQVPHNILGNQPTHNAQHPLPRQYANCGLSKHERFRGIVRSIVGGDVFAARRVRREVLEDAALGLGREGGARGGHPAWKLATWLANTIKFKPW